MRSPVFTVSDFESNMKASMSIEEWNVSAVLWLHCEVLRRGTLLDCLRGWVALKHGLRSDAYIQTSAPVKGTRRHRASNLTDLADCRQPT